MRARIHMKKTEHGFHASCPFFAVEAEGKTKNEVFDELREKLGSFLRDNFVGEMAFTIDEGVDGVTFNFADPQFVLAASLLSQRKHLKWTLQASVDKAGERSKGGLAQYESGRNEPGLRKMQQFLAAFGYDLTLDLWRKDPPSK